MEQVFQKNTENLTDAYQEQQPVKDTQTVTPEGKGIQEWIDGVKVRHAITHSDERGTVVEVMSSLWDIHDDPLVYVYQVTIRPNFVKGWTMHQLQDDRIFHNFGTARWLLYDLREGSPTHGILNKIVLSEYNRALLIVPAGVYHCVHNIGTTDTVFINCPTKPYNHADPDKFRLPLNNDLIPYTFDATVRGF